MCRVCRLYSERPLSSAEAYASFVTALRGLGFAVVDNAGLLKIVPEADAKLMTGTVSIGAASGRGEQVVTQVFRLNHESTVNLVPVLRPLIGANNTINANAGTNTLVITDYADNVQRMARLIAALDVPAWTDIEVMPLKHTVASDLAALVQRLADNGAAAPSGGAASALPGGVSVVADPNNNALIVRAQNAARLVAVRGVVDKLDRPGEETRDGGSVHPGRPVDQRAHHHGARAAVPPGARRHRPARCTSQPALCRSADRRGRCRQGRGGGRAVARHHGQFRQQQPDRTEDAKIIVGQNVPFVTGSYTTTSSTSNPFQTIERKDVGLTLRIRPQIGDGDAVRMTIFQESSSVLSTRRT